LASCSEFPSAPRLFFTMRRAAGLCSRLQFRPQGTLCVAPAGASSASKCVQTALAAQRRPMSSEAEEGPLVRLDGDGTVAKITLTRPKKLNSLSLPMIHELREAYKKMGAKCVLLGGEGRAFCAGGDVAEVREAVLTGTSGAADFFYEEYQLDYEIATRYEREGVLQVALWDGIVMGGGVGLSAHSPVRIATEKTMFAMPETLIGLFPDVGMTWRLSRLPAGAHVGTYLGLVGDRLRAADCVQAGLATHYCPSEQLPQVEEKLRSLGEEASNLDAVSAAINEVAAGAVPDASKAILGPNAAAIERCFGGDAASAEDIVSRLEAETCDWSKATLKSLLQRSPTSVKISIEAIQRHRSVSLKEAFIAEYRLAQWCMRPQPESDFCEGIRAVLIDKDNKAVWDPARLEDVSRARVEGFFQPLPASHPRGELKI